MHTVPVKILWKQTTEEDIFQSIAIFSEDPVREEAETGIDIIRYTPNITRLKTEKREWNKKSTD